MLFLDCPAYLDEHGALRCGLPAEVQSRFTMRSTDGPLEAAMIRCPSGHWFNGPIEFLTWEGKHQHQPGNAAAAPPPRTASAADRTTPVRARVTASSATATARARTMPRYARPDREGGSAVRQVPGQP